MIRNRERGVSRKTSLRVMPLAMHLVTAGIGFEERAVEEPGRLVAFSDFRVSL